MPAGSVAAVSFVGVDHVQVAAPAGCEAAARRFYGELLGLEELAKPALLAARGGVWFAVGAQELHVGVDTPFSPARKAHPGLLVSSSATLHALATRLEAAGVGVTWADPAEIPGRERFHCEDPFGNRVELLAQPSVRVES